MSTRFVWEAIRADGSIARGFATSPEEAGLHRMPDDRDFLCVIERPRAFGPEREIGNDPRARLETEDGSIARPSRIRNNGLDGHDAGAESTIDTPERERPIQSWFERPIRRRERE